jgi:hypothetical protein
LTRIIGERPLWILLGLVVFFFAAPLFLGETFFFRDLSLFALPQRMRLVELVRTSGIPLWDPYLHGGQPFLANPSNLALYPTGLLYLILPAVTALNWEIVLHYLLCAFAAYWLSRTLGFAPLSSLIAGVAFTLCGFTLSSANLLNRLLAMPHTVFLLLFFHLFFLEKRTRWFLGAVASGALVILAGSVEFLLLAMALAFGWTLAYQYPPGSLRPRARVVAWLVLGLSILGVAAIQILPGLEVVGQSRRGSGLEFESVTKSSLDPRRLPEFLVPGFLGPTNRLVETDYWGSRLEEGYPIVLSIFFGVPVLVLALIEGVARADDRLPRRFRHFLLVAAGASILLALGRFALFTPAVYRAMPFASVFRYPIKSLAAAVLPMALLAGGGAERVLRGGFSEERWGRRAAACLLAAAGLGVVLSAALRAGGTFASAFGRFFFGSAPGGKGLTPLALPLLHSALAAFVLALLLIARRAGTRPWLPAALAGLVIADLAVGGRSVNGFIPRALLTSEPSIVPVVRRNLAGGRLFRDHTPENSSLIAPSNEIFWRFLERRDTLDFYFGNAFNIPVIFHVDFDGLAQRRLIRLTSLISTLPWDRRLPLISAGNVTAILSAEELSVPGLERVAGLRSHSNLPFFLYRNSTAAPRAGFVSTSAFVSSETDAVKAVLSRGFDPRRHVVLEGRGAAVHAGSCAGSNVEEIERRPASWAGRVTAACDGYLVFAEPFYPSWITSVDGLPKPAIRANVAFSAIAVPAGIHNVSRVYRPTSVAAGAALTTASAAVLLILARAFRHRTGVEEGTTPVTRSD